MSWKAGPIYPCNPATARSESTKLAVDPKGEKLVYTNGRAVIVRDLNNPALSLAYTQHTQATTVARISPSGFYCASGDVAGNVRIWDVTQGGENTLKLAARPLSGRINDLAWDGESKRLIVGGEGKDKFGAAFFVDSGSSCGELTGHSKPINALSVRHQRPFRAVTGSDDASVILHTAVPFKYDKMLSQHSRFVRDVQYSPDGEVFASVGSDGQLVVYEGKGGEVKGKAEREGSLMACSWSQDSKALTTAGADGVVAIWDPSTLKPIQTYTVGTDVASQQNGIVYATPNTLVSISLSGVLNVFDTRESYSSPTWRKLYGPTKSITASYLAGEGDKTFFAGSFDGGMKCFDVGSGNEEGVWRDLEGSGHAASVVGITGDGKGGVWSAAWDDKVSSIEGKSFTSKSIATSSQPSGVAATPSAIYVPTASALSVHPLPSGQAISVQGACSAVAAFPGPNGDVVAFGSGAKGLSLGKVEGGKVVVDKVLEDNKGEVLAVAFSPDGALCAAGDAAGRIILVDAAKKETIVSSRWTFHTGRVVALSFSPDGKRLASAGLDEAVYVWEVEKVTKNTAIKNAHPGGVSGVSWKDYQSLITSGADGCVRTWTVPTV